MLEMINPSLKVVQLEFLGLSREYEECLTQHTFQVAKAECFMFHTKRVTKVGIEWYLFALCSFSVYARRGADKRPRRRHSEIHAPCNRIGAWLTNFTACIVLIPNISNLAPLIACNPAERSGARHRVHARMQWRKVTKKSGSPKECCVFFRHLVKNRSAGGFQ